MQINRVAAAVACALVVMGGTVFAAENPNQESERMAAELRSLREQIVQMQSLYEARISVLEEKLATMTEVQTQAPVGVAQPQPARSDPVQPAPSQTIARSGATAFNPEVSVILQGAYAHQKNVEDRRIGGFLGSGGHSHEGHGGKRGFNVDHTELMFAANIDPYWRGQVMLAAVDEAVDVEEAWIQTTALGYGVKIKAGRFLSGIGYMNEQHAHDWDFYEQPLMYRALFGSHNYGKDGVQVKWVAPLDTFVEFGAEVGRGREFPSTDKNSNAPSSYSLFAHVGNDIGVSHSWRAGLSWLRTQAREREGEFRAANPHWSGGSYHNYEEGWFSGHSQMWIADFVYKWAPEGNPARRNFKLQGEYFIRTEKGDLAIDHDGRVRNGQWDTRQSGFYVAGVYKFTPNWRAGMRYDRLDSGRQNVQGLERWVTVEDYRPDRISAMVDYSWSDFSRLRLQYARDRATPGVTDNQVTLQYIMSLGGHGAHKF